MYSDQRAEVLLIQQPFVVVSKPANTATVLWQGILGRKGLIRSLVMFETCELAPENEMRSSQVKAHVR